MLVNIIQAFDVGSRRYLPGENIDVEPTLAHKWIADGWASDDTDGQQDGPSGVVATALAAGVPSIKASAARIGDAETWMESNVRQFTESISTMDVLAPDGQIGLLVASRNSDNPAPNFAGIGLAAYGINDNTVSPEPSWAAYFEARRSAGAGATYNFEADFVNAGDVFDFDPFTVINTVTGQTVNLWVTNGGGDSAWGGNANSAAIAVHPNPAKWKRGLVFRNGSLDGSTSEMVTAPNGYKLAWYSGAGALNSFMDHRQIKQATVISSSLGCLKQSFKARDGNAASINLDSVFRHEFYGRASSSTNYFGGFFQCIQRSDFSGGNARFSFDFQAANGDGTDSQVSLNGLGNNALAPLPDAGISLGNGSFRWSDTYTKQLHVYPPASATPLANGELLLELTSDTTLKVKVKGSDGVVRSATLALS